MGKERDGRCFCFRGLLWASFFLLGTGSVWLPRQNLKCPWSWGSRSILDGGAAVVSGQGGAPASLGRLIPQGPE